MKVSFFVAPPSLPAFAATPSVVGTCTYTDVSPPPPPPLDPIVPKELISLLLQSVPLVILHPTFFPAPTRHWKNTQCCTSTKERRVSVTITLYGW